MDRQQAQARITAALEVLRIRGWTTEQRESLVNGLQRDDAVETAERAANSDGANLNDDQAYCESEANEWEE